MNYGQTDEAVQKATGKSWEEWLKILDDAGADKWPHKDIADWLWDQKLITSGWWCQAVTVGYERGRGLRDIHQKKDGYSASASKTIPVAVQTVYEYVRNSAKRSQWCDHEFEITSGTELRTVNGKLVDGTRVTFGFDAKSDTKTVVALEHNKLNTPADSSREKENWKKELNKLYDVLV